jgi:Polyketide cyclase / dehydrase and lipid transport
VREYSVGARRTRTSDSGYQDGRGFLTSAAAGPGRPTLLGMAAAEFAVRHDTPLPPEDAWARLVDWPRHGRYVPLTTIEVTTPPPAGVGTVFTAHTGVGRLGFDDPMEIVAWDPPHFCRIEKRGRVMLGWAELSVEAQADGSRVTWREQARPARLPRFADRASTASGRLLFGRVVRRLLAD